MLGELLGSLTREPLLDLAFAALLTSAAHSSIAVMLLIASLAAGNVVTPVAAIALVLGANLGSAIPPVLEAPSATPASHRLPVGNLAFRGLGCLVALPFARPIAEALWQFDPDPATSAINFHIVFNVVLATVFIGVLDPAAMLLSRVMPELPTRIEDVALPLYLEEAVLSTPYLALTNASREALRMVDLVETMLRRLLQAITANDVEALKEIARTGKVMDRLQDALKAYLTQLGMGGLSEADARRYGFVADFAASLGPVSL